MSRLDQDRQDRLEPKRIDRAISEIEALGLDVDYKDEKCIKFLFKGSEIVYFPYSGWASGKTIKDGRGLRNLLKQLK